MFQSVEELSQKLSETRYFIDPTMTKVVFLADQMKRPLLLEGPAGSGNTPTAISHLGSVLGRVFLCSSSLEPDLKVDGPNCATQFGNESVSYTPLLHIAWPVVPTACAKCQE
jgi:hypothetical protein